MITELSKSQERESSPKRVSQLWAATIRQGAGDAPGSLAWAHTPSRGLALRASTPATRRRSGTEAIRHFSYIEIQK